MAMMGTYEVFKLEGEIPLAHDQEYEIVRDGIYGKYDQWRGFWGEPASVRTTTYLTSTGDLAALMVNYSALVGSLITIVTDLGVTRYNIKVKKVRFVSTFALGPSSPSAACGVICEWELEDRSTSYA